MKICSFCNSEVPEETVSCPSCGGNAFSPVCPNCGEVIREGLVCPVCGVHAHQAPKSCPHCHATFYTRVCPSCGYISGLGMPAKPLSKKKSDVDTTIYWILGYMFIFPIPATITTFRSKKHSLLVKILLSLTYWTVYAALSYLAVRNQL